MLQSTVLIIKHLKCLTLVDFDEVEAKNLNNQRYVQHNIGQSKVSVVAQKIQSVIDQKNIRLQTINSRIQNVPEALKQADLIIGCVDNIQTRHYMTRTISPKTLILDLGSEELQGTVRFYGWYFSEFISDLFIDVEHKPIPLCQQRTDEISENYIQNESLIDYKFQFVKEQQNHQQLITYSDVNRFVVNKGFEYLAQVVLLADGGQFAHFDMIHISFTEIYFEQPVLLRKDTLESVIIDVESKRIIDWPRFGIVQKSDLNIDQTDNQLQLLELNV